MDELPSELTSYFQRIEFPVSKEELINGLLAEDAPGPDVSLVERLPKPRYESTDEVYDDLREISLVHPDEVAMAKSYDDYLELVIRHVGDVSHSTKDSYNRVVARIVGMARQQGHLTPEEAERLERRLDGAFAELRGSMTEVTNDEAALDPREDLPQMRRPSRGE